MKSTRTFVCLLLVWLFTLPVIAQQGALDPAFAAALQLRLDQLRISGNLKGMSASVIVPGKGVWRGVSGVSHGTVPIDTSMVFGIGSVTKTLVTTTVMLLEQDNLLSLNDSVHNWLPVYPNINPNITIRQLLQHRSGIANYTENQAWGNAVNGNLSATWTADQILNNYILAPLAAPGGAFRYSNTNFVLLGRIIEEATDSAWWDVVRYRLLQPHQLSGMFAEQIEAPTSSLPHHWQVVSGTAYDISVLPRTAIWTSASSAGIMASNAYDVARFGQLLFQGQVLQPASLAQMLQFTPAAGGTSFNGYGMGVFRISNLGQTVYGHGGNIPGFSSMLIYSPGDSISVSVLTNQDSPTTPLGLAMLQAAQQYLLTVGMASLQQSRPYLSCYPNPINSIGTVELCLPKPGRIHLRLLNSLGQEVALFAFGEMPEGSVKIAAGLEHLPAGIYFCRLETESGMAVQRWVVGQ